MRGETYRITVLTERLLRLEYQSEGKFVDEATQTVVSREFPEVAVETYEKDGLLFVETEAVRLSYNRGSFTTNGLSILLKETGEVWHYSVVYGNTDQNLFGTARTLDLTDGLLALSPGLFGRLGYAVLDDSGSAILRGEEFVPREAEGLDLYVFCYGTDFYGGLRDFYRLCGKTPLLPRYALGNWWSRYHRYTEESYTALLDRFEEEKIPLSVVVLDMDWHLTEVDEKYGTGWTGYTWDPECFPKPERFLKLLKERRLATTLNLHPADGVRAFESMYEPVARRLGIEPESEAPVEFDFSDADFRDAYFEEIMHPYEDMGVDFWWIDWQQGTKKGKSDVDPLFLLNHYHFKDQEGRARRPMIFSRYAGVGSHRYPIGFSGDTVTSWRSLTLQPYFTATASNIGYGWWSHDIGGHMMGDKDEERLTRWVQFGVFSPVMRLHSSNSPFFHKEPWNVGEPYQTIIGHFMRLRHRLLPYLYTMAYRAYADDKPLVAPVYYELPEREAAYRVPNSYFFGSSLLIGAITEPIDPKLRMAAVSMTLPPGRWFDIFTGQIYAGNQTRKLYRGLNSLPALLPAGGIVPESCVDTENGTENPASLRLLIGYGADGEFTLYEDDGISMDYRDGKSVTTRYSVRYDKLTGDLTVEIAAATGTLSLIPEKRKTSIRLYGAASKEAGVRVSRRVGEKETEVPALYDAETATFTATLPETPVDVAQIVTLTGLTLGKNDREKRLLTLLNTAWCETWVKETLYDAYLSRKSDEDYLTFLRSADVDERLKDAVSELFSDEG